MSIISAHRNSKRLRPKMTYGTTNLYDLCRAKTKMNVSALRISAVGLAAALAVQSKADCQPLLGEMGPQSRATIRISVSVAPRFQIKEHGTIGNIEAAASTPQLSGVVSNSPGLRYTIEAHPALRLLSTSGPGSLATAEQGSFQSLIGRSQSGDRAPEQIAPLLLIVVPD